MTADSIRPINTVLLIEDNPGDVRLIREIFSDAAASLDLKHAGSLAEARSILQEHAVDLILLDLGLPDVQGLDAVRQARAAAPLSRWSF